MKVKLLFINLLLIVIVLCLAQVFLSVAQVYHVPPLAEHLQSIYKSGYFKELDRSYEVIADSFIEIKIHSNPAFAWIYLSDIEKKHGIKVSVYDSHGRKRPFPASASREVNKRVLTALSAKKTLSESSQGRYRVFMPVLRQKRCIFCHRKNPDNGTLGALVFNGPSNPFIYFSSERMYLFLFLSIVFSAFLFLVIRWDPEKHIKELFDK